MSTMAHQPAAKSESGLQPIGEKLKAARESKNLSLEQARIKTRIHPKILGALEEGKIDEIVSRTYAKGFLKKYAAFLGLNPDEIVREYLAVLSLRPPGPEQKAEGQRASVQTFHSTSPRIRIEPATIIYIVVPILLVIAILGLAPLFKGHRPRSKSPGRAVQAASPKAKARTRAPSDVPRASPQTTAKARSPQQQSMPTISISKHEPLVLTFGVKRPVYVRASKDGVVLFERVLRGRTVETVKADEKINLRVADIEALELYLNGTPLSISRKGEILDLEITRRGIKIK